MLNTLNRLSASILGKRDLYEIAWEIARMTAEHLQLEDCVVYSVNLETGILSQIATASHSLYRANDKTNLFELTIEEGIVGKVVRTGEYQLVNDTSKCADYLVDDGFRFSELAVPIIANGKVKVHKGDRTLVELEKGAFVGDMALLDQEPRSADLTTSSETTLLKISQDAFYELMSSNFEIMNGKKLIYFTLYPELFSNGWSSVFTS